MENLEPRIVLAAPVALDDIIAVTQDNQTEIQFIVANDSDADGDVLTIDSTTNPTNGTLATVGGKLHYTGNAGFNGDDSFSYTIIDTQGNTTTAMVSLSVNSPIDVNAARTQILAGFTGTLPNPTHAGKIVTYGPTAFSVIDDGSSEVFSYLAGGSMGQGRFLVVNDHQWLLTSSYGDNTNMASVYKNGIDWLGENVNGSSAALNAKIVTLELADKDWFDGQGYTNVVLATSATLATELADADALFANWLGNNPSEAQMTEIESFVKEGGGVFVADYGPGYTWWWGKPNDQVPVNLLLRDAGVILTRDINWPGGDVSAAATTTNMNGYEVVDIIEKSVSADSAAEQLAFTKFAKLLDYLPADDALRYELNRAFIQHRYGDIQATPAMPQSSAGAKAALTAEASWLKGRSVHEIIAHPTAGAVFGDIPVDAERTIAETFSLDVDKSGWLTTGYYAVPGEVVALEVPPELVGQGYNFRINGHVDNISSRDSWDRLPSGISTNFAIESTTVEIANAFGGVIYLDVSGQAATLTPPTVGPVDITITGAIKSPTFRLGEMTDAQWLLERDQPGAYAELISNGLAMSVPSSWIRNLENPAALMTYWNDIVIRMDWVGGVESLRTGPERFNVDVQISVGLLHAGYPIQGPTWASEEIVSLDAMSQDGNWGYFHELGHEKQRHNILGHGYNSAWTFDGDTEVTVNIFANAARELQAPNSTTSGWGYSVYPSLVMERAATTINDTTNPDFESKDPYPFYFQLADGPWGWQGYRDVLSTYVDDYLNSPEELPSGNTAEKDEWMLRWSQTTGYDMTQYMADFWKLEVTQAGRDAVAALNLPNWMPLAVEMDVVRSSTPATHSKDFDLANAGVSLDDTAIFVNTANGANGTLADNGDGTFTWTPNAGFVGTGTFEVTYESSAGNQQTFQIEIKVLKNGVLTETFLGIPGSTIASLKSNANYPDAPDRTDIATAYETPSGQGSDFGVRTRGYLQVPVDGDYTFWIASDDQGELLLSSDTAGETI